MTGRAEVRIDPHRRRGVIDDRVYGQFIEHIGRAIYGGVFEPGSPLADGDGYRTDVIAAAAELRPSVLRWPGGNFASGYHWRDGVGPVASRPTRRDLAWDAVEPNTFGTEEFLAYCRRLGAAPYLNLNLSTGTVDEALGWLEYTNGSDPVPEVLLRRGGPHPEPHGVRIWGLGNENYGWWQHGHLPADRYAEQAREWAKLLRWADPSVQLIGVGATPDPDWNWTVLNVAGRYLDHLSLHFYWHIGEDPYHSVVAGPAAAERDIEAAWGMCLAAQRRHGLSRPVTLAVDEWGVWAQSYRSIADLPAETFLRWGFTRTSGVDTRFEERYDLKDALAVASWLHVLWRHPEKVTMATQAQMVNVIAPILTTGSGLVRQTVFHPLALARAHAGSEALDLQVRCETTIPAPGLGGSIAALDAAGTMDAAGTRLHLSLVNRSRDEELDVSLIGVDGPATRLTLWNEDHGAMNTALTPSAVVPVADEVDLRHPLRLPAHSHVTLVARSSP